MSWEATAEVESTGSSSGPLRDQNPRQASREIRSTEATQPYGIRRSRIRGRKRTACPIRCDLDLQHLSAQPLSRTLLYASFVFQQTVHLYLAVYLSSALAILASVRSMNPSWPYLRLVEAAALSHAIECFLFSHNPAHALVYSYTH